MKQSPHDWLLARHRAATPSLDSIRRTALETALRDAVPVPISQLLPALFLPNRRLWTALAATWVILLVLHVAQRPASPASATLQADAPTNAELVARVDSFLNRQTQLHALLR